jgi:hypothetical protein
MGNNNRQIRYGKSLNVLVSSRLRPTVRIEWDAEKQRQHAKAMYNILRFLNMFGHSRLYTTAVTDLRPLSPRITYESNFPGGIVAKIRSRKMSPQGSPKSSQDFHQWPQLPRPGARRNCSSFSQLERCHITYLEHWKEKPRSGSSRSRHQSPLRHDDVARKAQNPMPE